MLIYFLVLILCGLIWLKSITWIDAMIVLLIVSLYLK